jgi:hypothetical protein
MSTISESRHLSTSASWGPRCSRRFTSLALIACTALFLCRSIDVRAASPSPQGVLDRFLAASARRVPVPYRAVRRLEASSTKLNATAWVEALTEFKPHTGLHVQILSESRS